MLWPSSTDSSFLGIGAQCKQASSAWKQHCRTQLNSAFILCFSPDCEEAFTLHLTQTTSSFIFTCHSCSVRVKQPVPPLCLQSRTDRVFAGVSASALKSSVSQEIVEQASHTVLGLSALKISFMLGFFLCEGRRVFTGIEITHFTRGGPDTESRESFRHLPAF